MSFDAAAQSLGTLEEFDPKIFVDDDAETQNVCDFALALAAVSNDLRDAWLGRVLLQELGEVRPTSGASARWGLVGGLAVSAMKMVVGVLNELLELIETKRAKRAMCHPLFETLLARVPEDVRDSWRSVVGIASGEIGTSGIRKTLTFCRNHVAFHYDPTQLGESFRDHFAREHKLAFISRGNAMRQVRFYFADAAVERHLLRKGLKKNDDDFQKLVEDVVRSTVRLVTAFIELRGGAWREFRDVPPPAGGNGARLTASSGEVEFAAEAGQPSLPVEDASSGR